MRTKSTVFAALSKAFERTHRLTINPKLTVHSLAMLCRILVSKLGVLMDLEISELRSWRRRKQATLWLTEKCDLDCAKALLSLSWSQIWSALPLDALKTIQTRHKILHSRAEVPPDGFSHGFEFIYNISRASVGPESAIIRERRAAELENLLEGWLGGIVVAGSMDGSGFEVLEALAPKADFFRLSCEETERSKVQIESLVESLLVGEETDRDEDRLSLKDAPNVSFENSLMAPLDDAWELITRRLLRQNEKVTQAEFDGFLSGARSWKCLANGAAHPRGPILDAEGSEKKDLIAELLKIVRRTDTEVTDPNEAITRLRLFAETGSGCTTLLKQAALEVASAGYPVLISRPFPRRLRAQDLIRLIINVQESWAEQRSGKGSGTGNIPFCLILDSDAELPSHAESIMRSLSTDLNRKLVVLTAHRRSRVEIEKSDGTLKLYAESSEEEMLSLGQTLRTFCERWGLERIPTEPEWKIFYNNFGVLRTHSPLATGGIVDTPALFLVGLFPFARERVRDQRGLARYLFTKWKEISDEGLRKTVEALAAASVYGSAIPLECAIRDPLMNEALTTVSTKDDSRLADFFMEWAQYGRHTYNWALHMRHPAMGSLLLRLLTPEESLAPYSALTALLKNMTGSSSDVWFAEQLAYKIGRYFHSSSDRFSLQADTPVQAAARAVFDAIPEIVASQSRVIKHHHARYNIHLLHACLDVLKMPESSSVPPAVCLASARAAYSRAAELIDEARSIPSEREGLSYLQNSLAAAATKLAVGMPEADKESSLDYFSQAISLASNAINEDVANGHAIVTYLNGVQRFFDAVDLTEISVQDALALFVTSEDRLHTLLDLKASKQWRNVEDSGAELTLYNLIEGHNRLANRLNTAPIAKELIASTPGAQAAIELRKILKGDSIKDAFTSPKKAAQLRDLRKKLVNDDFFDELLDLRYRLYVSDPIDRFNFEARLHILNEMAKRLPEEYVNFLHDHATLAFQLEHFEISERLFQDLRARRASNPKQWFWHNERIFVSRGLKGVSAQKVTVRVTNSDEGWASYDGRANVKIQPRQWGEIEVGSYLNVFIRFRIVGLQGIDKRLADYDLQAIGVLPQGKKN